MGNSWNFDPKDRSGSDGGKRRKGRPQPTVSKAEKRRQERALKTGDVDALDDLDDDYDYDSSQYLNERY